jgi:hypothetical protein
MKNWLRLAAYVTVAVALLWAPRSEPVRAQEGDTRISLSSDWSHHHMVFSRPASWMETLRWQQNPRYIQQLVRRNVWRSGENGTDPYGWFLRRGEGELKRDWSQSMGSGATLGAGQYPAKFSFDVKSANCSSDFVAFHTGLAASASQASIIAYSNLYVGCGGSVPTVYWAYDTGGTISTSVTLSQDGSQVAFVQAQAGVATLVVLKWKASASETASAPLNITNVSTTGPGTVSNANYRACTAPCMTTITFNGSPADTLSAPYYDFTRGSDVLYVGDDAGKLHEFTGVFAGTPAESGAPWPAIVASVKLSSPVYDSVSGNVFVMTSRQTSNDSGARFAAVCATSACAGVNAGNGTIAIGTATPSLVLGPTKTPAVACNGTGASGDTADLRVDAPIVDSTAGKVYVFLGNNGNSSSAVYQFSTTVDSSHFAFHSCGTTQATVGTGSTTGIPLFSGDFDNVYYSSASGASPSGNLYVCGNTSGNATLYQLRITSDALATSGTPVLAVSSANTTCSPVTESDTGSTDRIFLSVQSNGATGAVACPVGAGCVMSFNVPTTLGGTLPTGTAATLGVSGGTSGIIIDNNVVPGTLRTSEIYFSTLTGSTAIQASQAGLQ